MKNFITATLILIASYCHAQPEDVFIPCHHAHQHANLHRSKPTDLEIQLMENSNKRSDSIDIINYDIDINVMDYIGKSIRAFTTVTFKPRIDGIQSIQLDLKSLTVDSVKFNNDHINYNYESDIITVFFASPLTKDQETQLTVYYHGQPSRDPVWGGFYFEDNYIYNLGIGLSTTPPNFGKVWFPCFDNFVERSTFDYHVTTSNDRKAYCVGTYLSSEPVGTSGIKWHYRMNTPITTYLSSIAASTYAEHNDMHQGLKANIPIQLVAKPADLSQMKTQFAKIATAIDAFEYWFGHYRFERVGFVATTVGAMEHPTNVAYPVSTIQGGSLIQNERLYAHEYGHHWWGDVTTLDDAKDMWIKEGTAEYSSHLFIERAYGKDEFIDAVKSNLSNILFNAHRNDGSFLPLSPMPYEHTYGTHTYRKGAAMLHNMRGYLDDDAFRNVCHMIFDSLNGKSMNAYEFRDFLNKYSGKNMTDYFEDYIFNPGYCTFYVDSFHVFEAGGQHHTYIQLKQKSYHAAHLYNNVPLRISLYNNDMERIEVRQTVSGEVSGFNVLLPVGFTPVVVIVNEEQDLNFASLQSHAIVNKTGAADIPYTAMVCTVTKISDSTYINIAHHLVPPDVNSKAANIDQISSRHFWQVHTIQHGELEMTGRVEYNGADSASIDNDILYKSEDSLLLVYRKDWSEPWREYSDYNKLIVNPTDRKGFVRITKLIPGDYALAHGHSLIVANENLQTQKAILFPNPVSDLLHIETDAIYLQHIEIIDRLGRSVLKTSFNTSIDVSKLHAGMYEFIAYDAKGKILLQEGFVKQ